MFVRLLVLFIMLILLSACSDSQDKETPVSLPSATPTASSQGATAEVTPSTATPVPTSEVDPNLAEVHRLFATIRRHLDNFSTEIKSEEYSGVALTAAILRDDFVELQAMQQPASIPDICWLPLHNVTYFYIDALDNIILGLSSLNSEILVEGTTGFADAADRLTQASETCSAYIDGTSVP